MDEISKKGIFGRVQAHVYTIEFQKRGLPHAHIPIILHPEDALDTSDTVDSIVCAEIPHEILEPELFDTVKKCMVHGPCGDQNPNAPCMEDNCCKKQFPKDFTNETTLNGNGYPLYKRRPGSTVQVQGKTADNRFIVTYNKYLCRKFACHINIEVCSSLQSVKYVFKYIYKGYDCINYNLRERVANELIHDEVSQHVDARYVSAPEGMWRLLENKMHDRSHSVIRLPVHLPQTQLIYFQQVSVE